MIENHGIVSEEIIAYNPIEINSINLEYVSWYILTMIALSHCVLILTTSVFLWKNKEMFRMNIGVVLFLGVLFPIHFSNIGLMTLKVRLEQRKAESVKFFEEFELRRLENKDANRQYEIIQHKIAKTEEKYVAMVKLRNSNGKWETLFEHLPSAVLIISLWLMSYYEISLQKFLMDTFMYEFAGFYYAIIILMSMKTATSCISAVLAMRYVTT